MAFGAYDVFVESWSMYGTPANSGEMNSRIGCRWNSPQIAAGGGSIDLTGGRLGNPACAMSNGSNLGKTMAHNAHWIAGNAFKPSNLIAFGGGIFALSNNNVRLFQLNVNPDGTLSLTGANQSQIIFTTPGPIAFNGAWFQWETDVAFSGTTNILCTAELRVNGVVQGSGSVSTGVNMASLLSNSATANFFVLGPGTVTAGGGTHDGAFYLHNTGGAVPGYWGDIRILKVVPDGDTAQADWTPNSGLVHYDRVHELPKDDNVTYLTDGTPGDKDAWDWEDLSPVTGVIRTVQLSAAACKDDEGSKSFRTGVGDTLSEAVSDTFDVNDSYLFYHFNWDLDPATGLAWTIPNFNAKRFGIEVVS
jgi:hypothetical protein